MEKTELVTEVSKKAEISEDEVTKILDEFIDSIKEGLMKGEKVNISGFGSFSLSKRKAWTLHRDQKTSEVPARVIPHFKADRHFHK